MSEDPAVMPTKVVPHATLAEYYPDDQAKRTFIRGLFDKTAGDYDRIERAMAFGTGSRYRREALQRAGLASGKRVLDVAAGTGLVSREAIALTGDPRLVLGVEPSEGMLAEAVRQLSLRAVRAVGERLPLAENSFDFLSMGYALRHLSDLMAAFREFHRVLKPGGTVCILEITRPASRMFTSFLRLYMRTAVPWISRIAARAPQSPLLWQYYWDTIEACVPPENVLAALRDAGFVDVKRWVQFGVFSEYTGRKPE